MLFVYFTNAPTYCTEHLKIKHITHNYLINYKTYNLFCFCLERDKKNIYLMVVVLHVLVLNTFRAVSQRINTDR